MTGIDPNGFMSEINQGGITMETELKLKTLKDIEFIKIPVGMDNVPSIVCGEYRLAIRKEAIKWVKWKLGRSNVKILAIRRDENNENLEIDWDLGSDKYDAGFIFSLIDFHNITSEDI